MEIRSATQIWQALVTKRRRSGPVTFDRRALEVCLFVHLTGALEVGYLSVVRAEGFADYRAQLLQWDECEARLPAHCAALGIPSRSEDFAAALTLKLTTLAAAVDAGFPGNAELRFDADGTAHLKHLETAGQPPEMAESEQGVGARMKQRHLLDILKQAEHWSGYTRHFGPPSGSDPKLANAV